MFFFIAGIQPKTVTLEGQPRMCRACGLYQGRLKRIDHYLSFFFIPLFRVKKGTAFVECQSCGSLYNEFGEAPLGQQAETPDLTCPACGKSLDPAHRFCPHCGRRVR